MRRLVLNINTKSNFKKALENAGQSMLMFDMPMNWATIRMTAYLDYKQSKEINDFIKDTKTYRIILEEVEK